MSKEYALKVFNTFSGKKETVMVTEEIYVAYKRLCWNEEKDDQSFYRHEIQFTSLIGGDDNAYENFREFISEEMNPAVVIEDEEAKKILECALLRLEQSDRDLIENLVMKKVTEREYAARLGVPLMTIHNRKRSAIKKIKKFL